MEGARHERRRPLRGATARRLLALAWAAAMALPAAAHAQGLPRLGAAAGAGGGLGGEAERRGEVQLGLALAAPGGPWSLGLLVVGSLEGYTGGWGCGTADSHPGDVVPSIATSCLQPAAGLFGVLGWTREGGRATTRVRAELAHGLSAQWLMPSEGGTTEVRLRPAWRARGAALARLGELFGGRWWIGLQAEATLLGGGDVVVRPSVAGVLEADITD